MQKKIYKQVGYVTVITSRLVECTAESFRMTSFRYVIVRQCNNYKFGFWAAPRF